MKIAQVTLYFHPYTVGGVEWYVYNMSRELVKMGHEVEVVTAQTYDGRTAPAAEEIEGIKVRRVKLRLDWSYRMKLWDGLSEVLAGGGYDAIHTYDYAAIHSLTALRVAKKSGVPSAMTVFDIHGMIPRKLYKRIPMKYVEAYFAHRTLPDASGIMVRAPELIDSLLRLGADRGKIAVTPSGVRDESLLQYDGVVFRQRYDLTGSPMVLFLGRMNSLKGPQVLVEAIPGIVGEFPDACFAFVGPDQGGYRAVLERRVKELGLAKSVRFTGPIYDLKEKMQAYAACDVFALPTAYEGTSQAIFEAMAQGKPVVATNAGGIPSQVQNGVEGLLVPYGDPAALADGIRSILRDKEALRRIGSNAREKAQNYRYSRLAPEMAHLYEGLKAN